MKRWKKESVLVLIAVCLCLMADRRAFAEEAAERLRICIPLMNDTGFASYEDGQFSGYYVDYLTEIAKYTGWTYEFIPVGSNEELEAVSESGEFDLMAGIIRAEEYDEAYFDYPFHSVGAKRYVFAVPKGGGLTPDKEHSYLRGTKIGVSGQPGTNELEERFRDFCFMLGIPCENDLQDFQEGVSFIHMEPSERQQMQESGEIDGILCSDAFCLSQNMYAIAAFGLDQVYFVAPNGREDVIKPLDDALEKIESFDADFSDRLYEKYFAGNMEYISSFSEEEQEYLKQEHVLKVAMLADHAPYTYINDKGVPAGMFLQVFDEIAERTEQQLTFEYHFYDSHQEAEAAVKGGECDINGVSMYSLLIKRDNSERRSMSFYSDRFMYYKGQPKDENAATEIVIPKLPAEVAALVEEYGYQTEEKPAVECLKLVADGEKGYTIMPSKMGDYYKSYYGYEDLTSDVVDSGEMMFCFAYGAAMDDAAISVIDKCLRGLQQEKLDNYITDVSMYEYKEPTAEDYIKEHMDVLAFVLAGVLLLICTLLIIIVINVMSHARKIRMLLYWDEVIDSMSYKRFLEEADRVPAPKLLLYVNISSFKYINDVFGYDCGNEVLNQMKRFIEDNLPGALFARIYADRFAVIVPVTEESALETNVRKEMERFEQVCRQNFPAFNIWVKIGAYRMKAGEDIQKSLILASYAADEIEKLSASDIIFYDDAMHDKVLMQKDIERDMVKAMDNGEFEAFYQPKYNIESGEMIGAEALIRWRHPSKGLLAPGIFIPIFEKNHFIIRIDFYIFECVCRLLQSMMLEGKKLFQISSNFSRLHLDQTDFVDELVRIARKYDVPAKYLEIEITETVATEDFDRLVSVVRQLKENGFMVSIDDFGSGHSCIQLLYKLPIDVLKFDKDFVSQEEASALETELLDSIITISHKNGIKIICEGVETKEQETFVRNHHCIYVQGYLYSRPVEEETFWGLLS